MTHKLIFGIDPGISGAIAALADGVVDSIIDTPVRARGSGGKDEVNVAALVAHVREVRARHVGAAELACLEHVQPMPSREGQRGMGAVSAFQYGRTVQAFHDVFEILAVPRHLVHASTWKPDVGMPTKQQVEDMARRKDFARTLAGRLYPGSADLFKTKVRGQPRAEALLIAHWGYAFEVVGTTATQENTA